MHRLPYSAVNFWAYEHITRWWVQRYPPAGNTAAQANNDVLRRLTAGGIAGVSACFLVSLLTGGPTAAGTYETGM